MRVIVATSDVATWENVSQALAKLGIESACCSTVEDCRHTFRPASESDYQDIFGPGRYLIFYPVDSPKAEA